MSSTEIFVGLPEDARSCITNAVPVSSVTPESPVTAVSSVTPESPVTAASSVTPVTPVSSVTLVTAVSPKPSPCLLGIHSEMETSSTSARNIATPPLVKSTSRVPNAPKSSIGEIFSADQLDGSPVKNGSSKPRVLRDTPTRPRDTHSRLFGQAAKSANVSPMITDTIRSNINFAENGKMANGNGHSPSQSPTKMNGSVASSPSRASYVPPRRNPVTGDGVLLPPPRRRHPAAGLREGNPITGDYKSMNGQINTVTSINGSSLILHNRVPPGGYSSGLW